MKTIKVNKQLSKAPEKMEVAYDRIMTSGSYLCLVTERDAALDLHVGDSLRFEKTALGNEDRVFKIYEEDTRIVNIVDEDGLRYIYFDYIFIKPLTIAAFLEIESSEGYQYKVYFTDEHHMLPGDLEKYGKYLVYVRRNDEIVTLSDLAMCYPNEYIKGEDIITSASCCPPEGKYFNYETMERNSLLIKNMSGSYVPELGDQVFFCTNPFFFTEDDGNVVCYDTVTIYKYLDYLGLGVVLEQDYDAKRMFQEYQVNDLFVKKIKNSIIPDFIDLEKIKYAPAFLVDGEETEETGVVLATGLTFNLHFRSRISGATTDEVPKEIARYQFEDTWHFDDASETWNGNGVDEGGEFDVKTQDELYADEGFVNSSNLMGYLDFTDNDIYNQKNRVKKTFIRLSFYDSKDPLTQNLLSYSTIFMDTGELYGKFLKRKLWMEETFKKENPGIGIEHDFTKDPVVWSPTGETDPVSAITSQLMVNDEYDMTRSGEGFNLYLFRADAPIEKDPLDIYMKIEFNHAGNGRTVPLICWPRETDDDGKIISDKPQKLTIENYLKNLYIKVRVSLTKKGYVYSFPDAVEAEDDDNYGRRNAIVWENERLVFNLFEPKITPDKIA